MKPVLAFVALLGACTTTVTHPSKSEPEMRADIDLCTESATTKFWYDAVTALYDAYHCLEEKGYKRTAQGWSEEVQRSMGSKRDAAPARNQPCVVPCR